ncbi:hypothetical protein Q9966_010017, partial [Columba livia]
MAVTLEVTTQNHTLVEQDVEKPGIYQCITFQASIAVATHLAVDALTFTSDRSPALLWIHCLLLCHGLQAVKFRIVNLDDDLNVIKKEYSRIWLQKIKNGCATFTVKTKTLKLEDTDSYIVVMGKRVEDGTGEYVKHSLHCRQLFCFWPFCSRVEAKEVVVIPVAMRMKSIEFINLHPFYKRGLPYTGKVFCHSSESPLSNETVDVNDEETHLSFLTDKNGEVHFSLDTTSWNSTLVSLKATYKLGKDNEQNSSESYTGVEDSFHWLKPFYSESNSFLEIKARNDVMPCDQEQEVQVDYILDQNKLSSEADHINFYYLAIAKRKILFNREKRVPILQHENLQGSFSLTLTIGNDFLPDIKLLLYAVFLYGEVALDFSHEKVPGSKVSLDLKAALGSPCSVQAVDKSVLLNKDNTLIANTILRMKILTNTRIKKPVSCMKPGFEKKKYIGKYSVFGKVNVTVSSVAEDSHNLFGNRIAVTPLQGERDTVIKPLLLKDTMLNNALHCLKNVTLDKTSLYVKALMAYVFTLRKDMEMREQLLDMLEKETAELLTSHSSSEESSSSSSMIETAAYILLAYVSKPDLAYNDASMTKLVHWLSGQRNAFGGFASTQDTVVSLQALAQYAALISQEIRDVKVTVKSKEASPLVFHVHRNNKLVLHQAPLPAVPGMYTVQATGSGCVYVQTSLYYNIPPPETEEVFVLDVETVPREWDDVRKQLDIHVSISYTGSCEISNMALVEVEMLSGFIPVSSSVTASLMLTSSIVDTVLMARAILKTVERRRVSSGYG